MPPLAIMGGIMAAGSIGGAAIASHGAGEAASAQSDAAVQAAQIQAAQANKALDFQKQEWQTQQQNMAPWLKAGTQGIGELAGLLKTPGQGLLTPFTAPTGVTMQNDPGYQFRLQQGMEALQNSQAAKGDMLSGNALEGLQQYGQNFASNEYQNVYNRAFNTFENNQANTYNRLAGLSGIGQQAGTTLGQQGQAAAGNIGNIFLTSGAQQGQDIQNAAAARASGYVGGANAWSNALSGGSNNLMSLLMMQQMMNPGMNDTSSMFG